MYTTSAKDERLRGLLRCGLPQLVLLHLKTEREEGRWATRRFAFSFSRADGGFPLVTGVLVFSSGEGQGISVKLEEARLWLGEEEWEPIDDEDGDAVALAFLLYLAGVRLVEIEEGQEARRQALDTLRQLAEGDKDVLE